MDNGSSLKALSSPVILCREETVPVFPKKPSERPKSQYLCSLQVQQSTVAGRPCLNSSGPCHPSRGLTGALTGWLNGKERGQVTDIPHVGEHSSWGLLESEREFAQRYYNPFRGLSTMTASQASGKPGRKISSVLPHRGLTRTTPSEWPVTMTFCVSHSFISDTQQQTICWLLPVNVFTLTIGFPLMLHTWIYVPAQDTMSPWEGKTTSSLSLLPSHRILGSEAKWIFGLALKKPCRSWTGEWGNFSACWPENTTRAEWPLKEFTVQELPQSRWSHMETKAGALPCSQLTPQCTAESRLAPQRAACSPRRWHTTLLPPILYKIYVHLSSRGRNPPPLNFTKQIQSPDRSVSPSSINKDERLVTL